MEVKVGTVAGIAVVAGPDLEAGSRIAGEGSGGVAFVVGAVDEVGLIEAARIVVGHRLFGVVDDLAAKELVGRRDVGGLFDEVGVDDEKVDVGFGEGLLDADAVEAGSGGRTVGVGYGIVPETGGTIAALGHPDTLRMLAYVALVSVHGGANLGTDALVGAEQGHVAVGCAAGDDLDEALVVEVAEALDDVAVERLEVADGIGETLAPEAGGLGVAGFAHRGEVGFIFAGGDDLALDVLGELGFEDGMGKLFEQDGRQVEVAVEGDAVALEIAEDAEQRQVGLGGSFMEPLNAMWPGSVVDDVRQVGVQGEIEKTSGLRCGGCDGLECGGLGCGGAQVYIPFQIDD